MVQCGPECRFWRSAFCVVLTEPGRQCLCVDAHDLQAILPAALCGLPMFSSITGGAAGFRLSGPARFERDERPEWLSGRSSVQGFRR